MMGNNGDCHDDKTESPVHSGAGSAISDFVSNIFGKKPESKACPVDNAAALPPTANDVAKNLINNNGLGSKANSEEIASMFVRSGKPAETFAHEVNEELARQHSGMKLNARELTGQEAQNSAMDDNHMRSQREMFDSIGTKPGADDQVKSVGYGIGARLRLAHGPNEGRNDRENPDYRRVILSLDK